MSREDYFCAEGKPHYNYDIMYYYDSPFFTHKERTFISKGGKSAYEVAVENGFQGTVEEWLASLKGVSPRIGENGNWFIGDTDTGVPANGVYNPNDITQEDIDSYFDSEVIDDGHTDSPITPEDIDSYFDREVIIDASDTPISQDDIDNYFDNTPGISDNDVLTFEEIDNLFE